MKQSNCYLYEYEHNKQVRNVGFVKYIQEENKITFQIHGKGMNCSKNESYEMYVFAGKSDACYVSRAGAVETEQGRINYMVTVEDFSLEQFNNYDGIYLHVSGEKKYVAMWNKSEVCFDKVESYDYLARNKNYEQEQYHEGEHCNYRVEHDAECGNIDEHCGCNENSCEENHNRNHQEDCCEESHNRNHHEADCEGSHNRNYHEADCEGSHNRNYYETSCEESHNSNHQDYVLNDCLCEEEIEEVIAGPWEDDFQEEEEKTSDITYEKIERQDIAKLPQREWKLANNSFLLHGYHNYQHILFIQEAGRSFIGVPGIYAPREADAAKNFGFPVFHRVGRRDMQWDEGEREYNVDFGYWCREVNYHNRNN